MNKINTYLLKIYPLGIISVNGENVLGKGKNFEGEIYFGVDHTFTNTNNYLASKYSSNNKSVTPINDFNLDLNHIETQSKRLFSIKFEINTLKYTIKDLLTGNPVFQCIKNETVLNDNSLIYIGETYIHINLGDESGLDRTSNLINLKTYNKSGQLVHEPM
jgi:hypothetical protein